MCTNNNGSFVCNCQPGYKLLDDGHTCLAFNVPVGEPPSLIFANSVDIRHILFNGSAALSKSQSLVQTHETLALDFLHRNRTVCWISHGHGSGNRQQQKVATTSPSTSNMQCANIEALSSGWQMPMPDMYSFASVNQIAADWASHNWYFVDDTREIIQLCAHKEQGAAAANNNKNVFMCKTILSVRLSKPRGIALDPNEGVMFFTIWGSDAAKLERASLDGNDRRVLVDSKIVYPYGLTVDFPMKRVYWVDTYLDYIEAVDYDGGNRKTILRGSPVQNLYSASVFENNLYVTSWRNNSIMRVNKFHPEDHVTVLNKLERPFAIQVFHRQRQPLYGNAVEGHDGRSHHPCVALHPCDHICLPIKDDPRYRCVCKSGYELSGSSKCVLARRSEFLLYGQQKPGVVRGLDLTTPKTEVIIPMIDLSRPTAMDYHAEANHLYLADSEKLRIERQSIQTGTKETFLSSGLNNIMGLAVDWVGRNLYWTDEGLQGIFVADVQDASKRALLISQDLTHPRSIVVDPVNGHMYWTNWPSGPPLEDTVSIMGKIERSWLDGSHREIFLAEDIVWPNGLSIDEEEKRIYWCDSYLQKIESMSLSNDGAEAGSSRKLHLSHEHNPVLSRPYGLTFHKKVIFWSEFEKGHIMRLDLETSNTSLIVEENPQLFSLKVFAQDRQPLQSHACEDPNTCQDLCLVTPNNGHVCKCRDGSQLLDDGKSCQEIPNWSPPSHCREHQFQCHRNLRCIDERYT
jgi:low-density lipoprotein receptor-related protein 1 (alpha-2-macroglobulin receptor)